MEQLGRLNLAENTLVIFASDNGAGAPGANKDGSSGPDRGHKGTAWDGGNREPLIIKWPGLVRPGTTTDALVSQVDFFKTFADLLATPLPERAALDSESFLPVLLGKSATARTHIIATKHKQAPYDTHAGGYFNVSITGTDKALGKLVAALRETGQHDNTLIVFNADHGMAFPGAKTTIYEAGLHVPFVVKLPGNSHPGSVRSAMISHADITPSLLDAAGGYDPEKRGPKALAPVPMIGQGENPGEKVRAPTTDAVGWR